MRRFGVGSYSGGLFCLGLHSACNRWLSKCRIVFRNIAAPVRVTFAWALPGSISFLETIVPFYRRYAALNLDGRRVDEATMRWLLLDARKCDVGASVRRGCFVTCAEKGRWRVACERDCLARCCDKTKEGAMRKSGSCEAESASRFNQSQS